MTFMVIFVMCEEFKEFLDERKNFQVFLTRDLNSYILYEKCEV